ncbi:MAG: PAS domain S-box protein [Desulfobacterales bacterium]|nr:PAS domain S-box protein [Desulfobacterales bacterium]
MQLALATFFQENRERIIEQWVNRLKKEVGAQYTSRPREELVETVTAAYDANVLAIADENFDQINDFITRIAKKRLEAGFLLSDVQKAFELFHDIVTPLVAQVATRDEFLLVVTRLNRCLNYTIHRFSDYFQSLHQKHILEHNRRLEETVRTRTADLQESELKYKTLVEEINDGYFVIQQEAIVFANRAFCRMHGYRLEAVLGKKFYMFVTPSNRDRVIELYNRPPTEPENARSFEYLRLTNQGDEFPTEILAKSTRYGGKPSNIGICRDITNRVAMEKKVRETERMAYIGQITTSLSHEIRNPLSAVKMNLQILKKNPGLEGNDQRRIDISVREVMRLEGILEELLDFAKPLQLKFESCSINTPLSTALELLEMKFKQERVAITTRFDPGLPDITGDEEKLGQAFINILLNALEASAPGAAIEISSTIDAAGDNSVKVTISDEGSGIAKKHIPEIFKPFYTTKSKGTGLGLSNASRIIEAHQGLIEFENRASSGVRFNITLPLHFESSYA